MSLSRLTLLVLVMCCLLTLPSACTEGDTTGKKQNQRPAPTVRADTVRREALVFYDRYPATVTPLEEVQLRPQISGYITRKHFRDGDFVRRGQRLFTIDVRRYQADVDRATADVEAARANLALAEKNLARYRRLATAEAIATQTLDAAAAEVEARRQAVAAAKASRASAATQLDYTTIKAPISGVTGLNTAEVGTQVSPGNPLLTTISQQAPIGVDFALPQRDIPRLADLSTTKGKADSTFRLRLPDGSLYRYFGQVYADGRAVNPRTGGLDIRLNFVNPEEVLRPGMSLEVEVLNQQAGPQVLVPRQSIAEQLGEYFVFRLQDSTAYRQKVKTGAKIRDKIVVLDGLQPGAVVVTDGLKSLQDSSKVRVISSSGNQR